MYNVCMYGGMGKLGIQERVGREDATKGKKKEREDGKGEKVNNGDTAFPSAPSQGHQQLTTYYHIQQYCDTQG